MTSDIVSCSSVVEGALRRQPGTAMILPRRCPLSHDRRTDANPGQKNLATTTFSLNAPGIRPESPRNSRDDLTWKIARTCCRFYRCDSAWKSSGGIGITPRLCRNAFVRQWSDVGQSTARIALRGSNLDTDLKIVTEASHE